MPGWSSIIKAAQTALELENPSQRASYLATLETTSEDAARIREILHRSLDGFMATSADAGMPDDTAIVQAGDVIGQWRVTTLLGRGGMGEVWQARRADGLYDQVVALKLMRPGDAVRVLRFDEERRRLARMEHSGISRIIDGGITDAGIPFMAMEYVDGIELDRHTERLALPEILKIFVKVCDAVHHAHSKLVLHRDIKPANIMVDSAGAPRLIDFGIASSVEDDSRGGPLTIAYAAPEQLLGGALSVQTDIFALGLVLHKVLTGRLPERDASAGVEISERIRDKRDLALIVKRATATDPSGRYGSVDAFGGDIRALLERRPIEARKGQLAYRISKNLQRYPLASSLGGLSIAALITGLVSTSVMARRAAAEADRANSELVRAEFFLDRAERAAQTQSAYTDALLYVAGSLQDTERLHETLLGRASDAAAQRAEDPERAAQLAYAIGRSLVERNDFAAAVSVLEPWIEAGYGDPALVTDGKMQLARGLAYTDRTEEAVALFREVEDALASGPLALSRDRIYAAIQIGQHGRDKDALERARELLRTVQDTEASLQDRFFFLFNLHLVATRLGDFEEAYAALVGAHNLQASNPLLEVASRDQVRGSLAAFELYHKGDLARAETLAREILETSTKLGDTRRAGSGTYLLGEIEMLKGQPELAEALIRRSIEIETSFAGVDVGGLASLVEAQAAQKIFEGAEETLESAIAATDPDKTGRPLHPRLILAKAYLAAHRDDVSAAEAVLREHSFTRETAAVSVIGMQRVALLESLGVTIPD